MALQAGDTAPDTPLRDQDDKEHSLSQYKGSWVLLYFYPKDDTPGCTKEACGFRDFWKEVKAKNCQVLGVSADSTEKHKKFADKYELPFPLLSDPDRALLEQYGAWQQKSMYGRLYMGIVRMSFLIDPKGKIAKVYPKVKAAQHAEEVLNDLKELQS